MYEDTICVVIMDKFPAVPGQTLVIPKQETEYLFALSPEIYGHLFMVAKRIAIASDQAFNTIRTCLVVEGFEVPHVHLRLYPMTTTESLVNTILKQHEANDAFLAEQAEKIRMMLE